MSNKLKICRCCLTETKTESELYEFSSEVSVDSEPSSDPQNFVKIGDCFTSLTSVSIPPEAEDQSKICSQCLGDLKFAYIFQKKCLEAEKSYSAQMTKEERFVIEDSEEHHDSSVIEYVEEEYIDDMNHQDTMNDEDTDDGFENSGSIVKEADDDRFETSHNTEVIEQSGAFSCELCPKIYDRKDAYRRHFRRSHLKHIMEESDDIVKSTDSSQIELHQCELCGKISVSLEEHTAHEAEHDGELRIKCKKCDARFTSKEDAQDHLNSAHSTDEKLFTCETCLKGFKNRYQLILHTRSHTGEKPFQCPVCQRCFSMSSNLHKHLDTHSTEKPYACTVCNQFFKTQRSLKFHTVCYHQPEAKVKCQQCDKSFVNKSYLKMHMLYHTGEKNFTCTICNSKYYKSSHLKRHIQNVHFKLRLMKCEYCASDFVRKETYRAHILSHHKRHLSDQEYEEVLERIKKFQPPSLDINRFTLEKQLDSRPEMVTEIGGETEVLLADLDGEEDGVLEVIDENSQPGDELMEVEAEGEYFEESDLYEDEQ